MIKNDAWIKEQAEQGMITPFVSKLIRKQNGVPAISFGVSSYGYDVRLSPVEFRIFQHIPGQVVNPLAFNPKNLRPAELHNNEWGDHFILPAHSYGLATTVERLQMPPNITGLVANKSTYVRCGVLLPFTILEAGWEGHITLEISNSSHEDAMLFANQGIAQILFFEGNPCQVNYAMRGGKYQGQEEKIVYAMG